MAVQIPGFRIGILTASADLSAKQYHAVKVSGALTVGLTSAAGEVCLGILQNAPASGYVADVMCSGVSKVISGAAIAAGAKLMAGADGRIITAATTGSHVIGFALEAAANANEYISAYIIAGSGVI